MTGSRCAVVGKESGTEVPHTVGILEIPLACITVVTHLPYSASRSGITIPSLIQACPNCFSVASFSSVRRIARIIGAVNVRKDMTNNVIMRVTAL